MRKGFTLVELSIVLVIIGLLIGGILVGRSLSQTAKITATVRQLSQYDAAISNFRTKYNNQWPGDSNMFPTPGNNDGSVVYGEMTTAWYHLSLGVGLLNTFGGNYSIWANPGVGTTEAECPILKLDQDKVQTSCLQITNQFNGSPRPGYRYQEGPPGAASTRAPIAPADAYAIDMKIDDGNPQTGNVFNVGWGSEVTPACATGTKYNLTNSYGCTLFIMLNTTNGVNQ